MFKSLIKLPLFSQLTSYNRSLFVSDAVAGLVTAFISIPQSMAYSNLAGLPPEYGLYCSLLPLMLYALLGSSRTLVVGPAALISLMIASTIDKLSPSSVTETIEYAVNLSLLTGFFLCFLSLLRLGNASHYISKPVITGFTSAAAIIIAVSQLPLLLGVENDRSFNISDALLQPEVYFSGINVVVIGVSLLGFVILWLSRNLPSFLIRFCVVPTVVRQGIVRLGPIVASIISSAIVAVYSLDSNYGVDVVGAIPSSLPSFSVGFIKPSLWLELAMPAVSMALICFLNSIAVTKSLASKRHELIDANQELLALGVANVGSALTGTFSLAGSLSRSLVNYYAGARTQVANIISAAIILLTVLFFTPLLYFLPQAVLGVIVIASVLPMVGVDKILHYWSINKADAVSLSITFAAVLMLGVDRGIWIGIGCSMVLLIHRTSKPHIAVVGRVQGGTSFRNSEKLDVETLNNSVFLRIDESLYFANVQHVEDYILNYCSNRPSLRHIVIIFSSVNFIDGSALETCERLVVSLRSSGLTLHLCEVKGIVHDQLKKTNLLTLLEPGKVFYSADEAMQYIESLQ